MVKLVNLTRVITSILFILVLLFVYANLPDRVGLIYKSSGLTDFSLDKNQFFYISLVLSLFFNLITVVIVKFFQPLPVISERFFFNSEWFKENFLAWLSALSPIMNLFFVFIVAFIGIYNNGDNELINSYGYLAYLGQFLILCWLILLVFIVLKKDAK